MVRNAVNLEPTTIEALAEQITGHVCEGRGSRCDQAQYPDQALTASRVRFQVAGGGQGAFSPGAIDGQIANARKPIEIFWVYSDSRKGGPVALISGCDPATQSWAVLDPYLGPGWCKYSHLAYYTGGATWTATYYGLEVEGV